MASENDEVQSDGLNGDKSFLKVILIIVAIAVALILLTIPTAIIFDRTVVAAKFKQFEQVSGVAFDSIDLDAPDYLYVWWEEWRVPKSERVEKEHTLGKELDAGFNSPYFWRDPAPAEFQGAELCSAFVGYLPTDLDQQVPPTGRLQSENGVAEYRLFVDWEGNPLPVAIAAKAALKQSYKFRSWVKPWYESKIENATKIADIKTYIESWEFVTVQSWVWAIIHEIRDGRIPAPKTISEEEHGSLRLQEPGKRSFGDIIVRPYGSSYIPIAAYAEHQGKTFDQAIDDLKWYAKMHITAVNRYNPSFYLFQSLGLCFTVFAGILILGAVGLVFAHALAELSGVKSKNGAVHMSSVPEYEPGNSDPVAAETEDSDEVQNLPAVQPTEVFYPAQPNELSSGTNVIDVYNTLGEKGPIGRHFETVKRVGIAGQTKAVVDAETEVIDAEGKQIKTVLKTQNKINKLQDKAALRELKRQKWAAKQQAKIAAHKYEEESSNQSRRDLKPKPPPPALPEQKPIEKPKKPSQEELVQAEVTKRDKALALYRQMRANNQIDDEALRRFQDQAQEGFEYNVDAIRERRR